MTRPAPSKPPVCANAWRPSGPWRATRGPSSWSPAERPRPRSAWLERSTAGRTRALVEERGLRTSVAGQRPPASVLGALIERDGPGSLGSHLAQLSDAAIVDSRVLLAHRLGADESRWPAAEDRFASDLLLAERIADPWLRELTTSAAAAPIPILLGGHTLVGPGVRLVIGGRRAGGRDGRHAGPAARRPPGSRRGRRGRRPGGPDPRGDRTRRADHIRPVHGPRAVRPGRRLLPGVDGPAGARRRLPDRAGGAPDLRGGPVARRRGRLGSARPAGAVRPPRARGGERGPGRRHPRWSRRRAPGPRRRHRLSAGRGRAGPDRRPRRPTDGGRPRPGPDPRQRDRSHGPRRSDRRLHPGQRGARRAADAPGDRPHRTVPARSWSVRRTGPSSTWRPTRRRPRCWPVSTPRA